jgi:hypothetical protein
MPSFDDLAAAAKYVPGGGLAAASFATHHWIIFGAITVFEIVRKPVSTILNGTAERINRTRDAKTHGKVKQIRAQTEQKVNALRAEQTSLQSVRPRRPSAGGSDAK